MTCALQLMLQPNLSPSLPTKISSNLLCADSDDPPLHELVQLPKDVQPVALALVCVKDVVVAHHLFQFLC